MKKTNLYLRPFLILLATTTLFANQLKAQYYDTEEVAMMRGVTKNFKNGWKTDPIFTVGETNNDDMDYSEERFEYRVPGLLDGMYPFKKSSNRINLYVNHEMRSSRGYPYTLKNGTELIGARVSKFRVQIKYDEFAVKYAELAYDKIYDRYYDEVTDASQINEGEFPVGSLNGLDRLCSANGIEDNKFGFEDDIFFTGEETGNGQEFALDIDDDELYCVPAMGRAAWESVCVMDNYDSDKVVILIGDDREGAPLLLYIGEKDESYAPNAPSFLKKNGLAKGNLFVWVADNGDSDPEAWNGTGTSRAGKFILIDHYQPGLAGTPGWDNAGWADNDTQDQLGLLVNRFNFSRPEDIHTNPEDGSQAIFASTGRPSLYPSDSWGTTYLIDMDEAQMEDELEKPLEEIMFINAEMTIVYDGDDAGAGQFADPDYGLRSPDNLTWAENGYVYINEDRSISDFCVTSGFEASVWQLNPNTGELVRILEMDRSAVPFKQTDSSPDDCGNWESSGTVDVTRFFDTEEDEVLLLLNVQAHSIDDVMDPNSPIGSDSDLSEGGQLLFASKIIESISEFSSVASPNAAQEEDHQEVEQSLSDKVYPNPANGVVNLLQVANVEIFNTVGTLMVSAEQTNQVDVSSLQAGVYFLTINKEETHKIVIK